MPGRVSIFGVNDGVTVGGVGSGTAAGAGGVASVGGKGVEEGTMGVVSTGLVVEGCTAVTGIETFAFISGVAGASTNGTCIALFDPGTTGFSDSQVLTSFTSDIDNVPAACFRLNTFKMYAYRAAAKLRC